MHTCMYNIYKSLGFLNFDFMGFLGFHLSAVLYDLDLSFSTIHDNFAVLD